MIKQTITVHETAYYFCAYEPIKMAVVPKWFKCNIF